MLKKDPFVELLLPAKKFADREQYESYLKALNSVLSWLDDEQCSVVIADGLVSDCPIVAVSNRFLEETGYPRDEVLYTNCRFLVDKVSYPDVFRISRSARTALRSYCQLARFPGALNSGSGQKLSQPNAMRDGTIVNNDFAVVRTYVAGHPFLIGVQKFSPFPQGKSSLSGGEWTEIEEGLQRITKLVIADQDLAKVLGSQTEVRTEGSQGLYHGPETSSYLLFYKDGFGVLRQEPEILPHSGVIVTAEPLERHAEGYLRYSLMVETLSDWSGDFPMGFTRTPPGSSFPKMLQFSPEHVGFTGIGVVCNSTKEAVPPSEVTKLQQWSVDPLPQLKCGDVVSVELDDAGNLSRYLNGKLMFTIATGMKLEGTWYGAFEVSMSVSRVCLLYDDKSLPAQSAMVEQAAAASPSELESKDFVDLLSVLDELEHMSITVALIEEDLPLVFVSAGFEYLTGFKRRDILGRNCRFLNQDIGLPVDHRVGILQACSTGSHFLSVLLNQRQDGSLFHNLLDLRTMEVGVYAESNKPARLLFGIQGEVDEGRTVDHWMLDLPQIVREVLEKVKSAIHKEGPNCKMQLGDGLIRPLDKPFWVEESRMGSKQESGSTGGGGYAASPVPLAQTPSKPAESAETLTVA